MINFNPIDKRKEEEEEETDKKAENRDQIKFVELCL
jgi:hypothetical protein